MRGWEHVTPAQLGTLGRQKPAKYRNHKVQAHGRAFDSKKEAQRYFELLLMHRAGVISEPQCQIPFDIYASNGELVAKYVADFEYTVVATGKIEREDVKGGEATKTRLYRLKIKLLRAQGIEIREI